VHAKRNQGARRLWLEGGTGPQAIEKTQNYIVNKLPIKLNLMPDFFSLLGRGKIR
jgi:hypothetical protein